MQAARRFISRNAVLRLLLPLAAGIVAHDAVPQWWLPATLALLAAIALATAAAVNRSARASLSIRKYHIVAPTLAAAAVGWCSAWVAAPVQLDLHTLNGKVALARIETVQLHEKSMTMEMTLLRGRGRNWASDCMGARIMVSTRGCDYDLRAGDVMAWTLDLVPIENLKNPDEMDYAKHLHRKGMKYRQHLDLRGLKKVGHSATLATVAFNLRQQLQHGVMASGMTPQAQQLVVAMLLGNSDLIARESRDAFSLSGVAHVLALSGLHVAIIALMLWFLLFPLDYIGARKLRLIVTMVLLVMYDLLTGLSPSVVRATVMMCFAMLSMIIYRKSSLLNSLFAAALVILVFSPFSLYGVGFQLSFITVGALIVFYQNFNVKLPQRKLLKWLCTTLLTSLVAMLSTLMLTAYYFNTVSFSSLLSNVVILPVMPVLMLLGACAILFVWLGADVSLLDRALDVLASVINNEVEWFASLPMAKNDVYVTWVAVVVYYCILLLVCLWLYNKNVKFMLAAAVVFIIGIAHGIVVDYGTPRKGLVVFNSYNSTPIIYFNGSEALLWVPDVPNDFDLQAFKRQHRAFLAHYGIDSIVLADSAGAQMPGGVVKHGCAHLQGKSMIAAGKGRWKHFTSDKKVKFDLAVVTKGFHSDVSTLKSLVSCDTVILSGGMFGDDNSALERECKEQKFPYYNIRSSGAYIIMSK